MMSSGGYPFPPGPSNLPSRRPSGPIPLSYDRPPAVLPVRTSPPPGSSRRYTPYEEFPPPRTAPAYRDGYSTYRQNSNSYRPESHPFYPRSPSPNRHYDSGDVELYPWDRSNPRQPSDKTWPDRRALTLSPTSSVISRDRVRSDPIAAQRLFEPSDAWKQTQNDRPAPIQSPKSPPVEKHGDRIRNFRDPSPERPVRGRSPPYFVRGDRYRPDQNGRGTGHYRPSYDDDSRSARQTGSSYRPNPDLAGRYYDGSRRRPSSSISSSRSRRSLGASRSRSRSRSRSESASRSRERGQTSGANSMPSPRRDGRSTSRYTGSDRLLGRRRTKSRSLSRSSIASTQVSDHPPSRHMSPGAVPVPNTSKTSSGDGPSGNVHIIFTPSPKSSAPASAVSSPSRQAVGPHVDDARLAQEFEPVPGLGLGLHLGSSIQDSAHTVIQINQQKVDSPPSPLIQEESNAQQEMADIHAQISKPALPTWDVVPTVPEPPIFDRAPSPIPAVLDCAPSPVSPSPAPLSTSFITVEQPVPAPPPQKELSAPTQPQIDYVFEDIPRLADAKSIADALRTVIMTRLLRDHQTREERVNPILMENLALESPPGEDPSKTQEQLIDEVSVRRFTGSRDDPFLAAKSWLSARFDKRQTALNEKKTHLQLEYQTLHDHWRRHCATLNIQAKPVESDNVPVSGRTTRRSAANLGDTVRSDLEMEQIIASLGYDEATDPNQLSARNLAIIPDMISVTGGPTYTFDDTNHLVENPSEYYAPYTGIHDWTEPEKELFLDKYAAFPKQFGAIAEFLPNKTASQCVDYYYLHKKKLIDFRRVVSQFAPNKRRRRRTGKQKGNGLLSDIRQHDAEVNRDSDDSPSYTGRPTRGRRVPEARKPSVRRNAFQLEVTSTATPTPEPEARPKRRRVAVSRSTLYQDDLDDDTDGEPKKKKRGRKPKSAVVVVDEFITPVDTPPIMDVDLEPTSPAAIQWSNEDQALFLELLAQHGENFKRIAVAMPNKTTAQVAEYFKSNSVELDFGSIAAKALQTATMDLPGDLSISTAASPRDTTLSSPPSPSASADALQDTHFAPPPTDAPLAESFSNIQSQNDAADVAARGLDPNEMWESMDPGSGAQSGRVSPAPSDPPVITPASIPKPAPVMASLTREPPVETIPPAEKGKSAPRESNPAGPSVVQVSQKTDAEKDAASQASSDPKFSIPVMSSLTFDPVWGYYDPEGVIRPPPTRHADNGVGASSRPYSPSQPVPFVAPVNSATGPPAVGVVGSRPPPMMPGPFAVPYPYYIPPPYPSAPYHPYSSYKS